MLKNNKIVKIHEDDNVAVALDRLTPGQIIEIGEFRLKVEDEINKGHKVALNDIAKGQNVIKYGYPIGHATRDIPQGTLVHSHNLKTNLEGLLDYSYQPDSLETKNADCGKTFDGYVREDGQVGIRNEIWIINTVGCINKAAEILVRTAENAFKNRSFDGVYTFSHPYGCSQLGDDHKNTQKILAGLVRHPNAGGVLVLGLGCENNNIGEFKQVLGAYNPQRVRFLNAQDVEDEIDEGMRIIGELVDYVEGFKRQPVSVSQLKVGLKCGGSDGFSGITANPLLGVFSDMLTACGGTTVLTEVPEMFGAETLLMNRCVNEDVFKKNVDMINNFKKYFMKYDQVIYENPSPGNKEGGITTLEEKSLGCTQKGGSSVVMDVLDYGEQVEVPGLNLLSGPGNDMVASTVMAAAGAHIILFTTGRGTPLGAPVPTIKVSTNTELFRRKKNWIDFNAGVLLENREMDEVKDEFFEYVLDVSSGKIRTRNEENGFREISIFKDGVTL